MQEQNTDTQEPIARRTIRSFVVRGGRMTEGQQKNYEVNWAQFGLNLVDGRIDYATVFGREIGRASCRERV